MTKQYTNTREPGEFGDEMMTDEELVEKLRTVNIATAPYACPEAVDWCHEAADRLSALSPRVKALEWEPYPNPVFAGPDVAVAQVSVLGDQFYQVQRDPHGAGYIAFLAPKFGTLFWESKGHSTIEEAKAAAQADYERRIMSAIEVSASPRVVTVEREGESVVAFTSQEQLDKITEYKGIWAINITVHKKPTGSYTIPLVRQSALTACQQEVERLRTENTRLSRTMREYMVPISADGKSVLIDGAGDVEIDHQGKLQTRNAELVKALDQLLDDMGENGLCVCQAAKDQAIAALKGDSNGE